MMSDEVLVVLDGSAPAFLLAAPEIAWEASLGIYAAWKGFRPSPITSETWVSDNGDAKLTPKPGVGEAAR